MAVICYDIKQDVVNRVFGISVIPRPIYPFLGPCSLACTSYNYVDSGISVLCLQGRQEICATRGHSLREACMQLRTVAICQKGVDNCLGNRH